MIVNGHLYFLRDYRGKVHVHLLQMILLMGAGFLVADTAHSFIAH